MVSDQTQGLTPDELFQELKSIDDEITQLNERLEVLAKLRLQAGRTLVARAIDIESPVEPCGLIDIGDTCYFYALNLVSDCVSHFIEVPELRGASDTRPTVQPST
ncbi:hypothetical protein IQ260_00570 [Leptolyngbya cf. ectocarpi LEGE 11479]|uniref:Uncharacterized protein n=1 Tax=Leptolyngbya cf. ectocarpi LEGE 11479 TaxID=1828722 RepID=A0A928X0H7_LEPEC|nr:hypothetical protein [Leptolyngbya ectocarpi]MBE9065146.1 hypothetical protein [Leptolyngbya cf. ectocarpi LEGE 11479]